MTPWTDLTWQERLRQLHAVRVNRGLYDPSISRFWMGDYQEPKRLCRTHHRYDRCHKKGVR